MGACEKCGAPIGAGDSFCTNCGAETSSPPVGPPEGISTPPVKPVYPGQPAPPPGIPLPPGAGEQFIMPPPPRRKGVPRGLKIGLVVGLVVVAVLIAGIVVGTVLLVNVVSAPADVANNYVRAVNNGNLATAYSYLAPELTSELSRAQFDKQLGPFKGKIRKWNTSEINVHTGGNANISMDISLIDGTSDTWDMRLVRVNGVWKIAAVSPRSSNSSS